MQYRAMGDTGLNVSAVGFGVWTVSTTMWGINDDAFAIKLLHLALDHGITFFDTADVYGDGKGETILAQAFEGRRDEITIATKFGYDFYKHPGLQPGQRERPHDWSPGFVRRACEECLRRLNTDRIDMYQLHNPRMDALMRDDLFAELDNLKAQGKIRSYGAALGPALKPDRQIEEGLYTVAHRRAAVHIIFNLLEQMLGEAICPVARTHNVPVLVRVPHASGLLEGGYSENTTFDSNDHRSHRLSTEPMRKQWLLDGLKKIEKLQFAADAAGRTLGQMAIQWLLAEPAVTSLFPNIYNEQQIEEFTSATDTKPFSQEELERVSDLYQHNFYLDMDTAA
jgi:aryl-alcohol dehydrogenase-like predicted oxidoreductase